MARTPAITELWVKVKTKTPVTRNGMNSSLGMPLPAPRITPKMRK